jgi:hypothetical protein
VTEPVAARGGLHVLRVAEVRPAAPRPLDEVRERIGAKLRQERFDARLRSFLAELGDKAYVIENLPADAAGYRSSEASAADPLRELMRGAAADAGAPAPPSEAAPEPESPPPAAPPPADRR